MTWSFAFPWAFLILPAPWFVHRFAPPRRDRTRAIRIPFFRQIAEAAGLEPHAGSVVLQRRRLQMLAAILCWLLLVTGLARPELLGQTLNVEKAARDMVLAVDISGSMDQRDMADAAGRPEQRLQVVKDVVGDFIDAREGDRIALIVFGSRAFVQTPFTEDLQSVRDLLEETEVGMAGPATAVGDAIGLAIRTFETSEVDQRLLVLLSDGLDTSSKMSPINAAGIAAQEGVSIYTIGVGDPEGSGEDRANLKALEDIAARGGGASYYATDGEGLQNIYNEIERLNPRVTETVSFQPKQPLAWIPFGLAALAGLATILWLLIATRRRTA